MENINSSVSIIDDVLSKKLSFILGYGNQEGKDEFRNVSTNLMTSGVYKAVGLVDAKAIEDITLEDEIIFEGPAGKIIISVYDVIEMFNYYVVKENSEKLFSPIKREFLDQQTIENVEDTIQIFLKHDFHKSGAGVPYPDYLITYSFNDVMLKTENLGDNYSIIPVASSKKSLKDSHSKPLGIIKQIISKEVYESPEINFIYRDLDEGLEDEFEFDESELDSLYQERIYLKDKRNQRSYINYKKALNKKRIEEIKKQQKQVCFTKKRKARRRNQAMKRKLNLHDKFNN